MYLNDLFLLFLGIAWLLVLWSAAVRARRNTPLSTATRFRSKMRLIAPKAARAGRWILTPQSSRRPSRPSHARNLRRRKQMFVALLLAAPLTAAPAAFWSGALWLVHVAADCALAGYVVFLLATKRRRQEAASMRAMARGPEVDFTVPIYEERRA
jgi:hypothetical protein